MNKAGCLSLLSNALLVWNTMAITKLVLVLVTHARRRRDHLGSALARIALLMHQHVIPNGPYHFASPKQGDDIAYITLE